MPDGKKILHIVTAPIFWCISAGITAIVAMVLGIEHSTYVLVLYIVVFLICIPVFGDHILYFGGVVKTEKGNWVVHKSFRGGGNHSEGHEVLPKLWEGPSTTAYAVGYCPMSEVSSCFFDRHFPITRTTND